MLTFWHLRFTWASLSGQTITTLRELGSNDKLGSSKFPIPAKRRYTLPALLLLGNQIPPLRPGLLSTLIHSRSLPRSALADKMWFRYRSPYFSRLTYSTIRSSASRELSGVCSSTGRVQHRISIQPITQSKWGLGCACRSLCNQGAQICGSVPCSTQEPMPTMKAALVAARLGQRPKTNGGWKALRTQRY
jgi:hypothetical protein